MTFVDWLRVSTSFAMAGCVFVNWRLCGRIERAMRSIRESNHASNKSNEELVRSIEAHSALMRGSKFRQIWPSTGGQA